MMNYLLIVQKRYFVKMLLNECAIISKCSNSYSFIVRREAVGSCGNVLIMFCKPIPVKYKTHQTVCANAVSYTHLDVYKRQIYMYIYIYIML